MPFLEIIHLTGDVVRHELGKQQPVTIGSHSSNDISIDEDGVEIMHCRVSWGKGGFEAVAAGVEGLDVNGTQMQKTTLKPGDTLRFGTVDIRYRESETDGAESAVAEDNKELGLKPISEEVDKPDWLHEQVSSSGGSSSDRRPRKKSGKPAAAPEQEEDVDLLSGLDALAEESRGGTGTGEPARRPDKKARGKSRSSKSAEKKEKKPSKPRQQPDAVPKTTAPASEEKAAADGSANGDTDDNMSQRLREALRSQQRRPGEEDPLRSPLVLGLAGGAVALILTGAIFYFIAGRQTTQQRFDVAKALYDEGNFLGAIPAFQEFIVVHPRDDLSVKARELLGLARVRQYVDGASPKFEEGLEQLRVFINEQRDLDDFESLHPEIMTHAKTLSLGAAVAAGRQFRPELLEIARESRTLLKTYAPKDTPPTETLDQIEQALRASEAAIRKNDVYKEHIAAIEQALDQEQAPLRALKLRRDLLVRYPEFESDKQVVALMNKTLAAEAESVVSVKVEQEALTSDHPFPADLLTLAFQGRTRTDEVAVGKAVIVLAKGCCYGVEFVTGQPLWRRFIGLDTPFFPILESNLPSLILFDTVHNELVRLHQTTGKLVWRLPLGESVSGQPLLLENSIYVATKAGKLHTIDLETGQLVETLAFSQPVTGPVELNDQQRLVVAGNEEVTYTLTKRPFECVGVSYFGQQANSVDAPLIGMGSYILMVENTSNNAKLHLIETEVGDKPLFEVATGEVLGRVTDPPVIRGRDLFVPSSGERITAFSVSDDPGQPPLTAGPSFQGESEYRGPIFLRTGPDRQVWMATGMLSRLQLTTDSLQPDGDPKAAGLATQPLKYVSGYLLNARRRPYDDAVTFTRTDRDNLTSDWQAVLGGELLAWTVRTGETLNIAAVNGAGHVFRIGERQFEEGTFLNDASSRLPLDPELVDPLKAAPVSGDRIAVVCGDPKPRLWLINAAGQIEGSPTLPGVPESAPCSLGTRIVVPLKNRVHVIRLSGQSSVQDFSLPTGEDHTWVNVLSVGEDKGVGVTAGGLLLLLKIENSPQPHLAAAVRVELGHPILHPASSADGLVAVSDASRTVSLFGSDRLDLRAKRTFDQPVSNQTWLVGGKLFVEEGQSRLHCIEPESALPSLWNLDLNQSSVAGITEFGTAFVIAQHNGTVSFVDRESGEVRSTQRLGNLLSNGPMVVGEHIVVGTIDGTLIRITETPATEITDARPSR